MEQFRILENKYGWYKIQLWYPPKRILFINFKGKWKDSCFRYNDHHCRRFEDLKTAHETMQGMIENEQRSNDEWKITPLIYDNKNKQRSSSRRG